MPLEELQRDAASSHLGGPGVAQAGGTGLLRCSASSLQGPGGQCPPAGGGLCDAAKVTPDRGSGSRVCRPPVWGHSSALKGEGNTSTLLALLVPSCPSELMSPKSPELFSEGCSINTHLLANWDSRGHGQITRGIQMGEGPWGTSI